MPVVIVFTKVCSKHSYYVLVDDLDVNQFDRYVTRLKRTTSRPPAIADDAYYQDLLNKANKLYEDNCVLPLKEQFAKIGRNYQYIRVSSECIDYTYFTCSESCRSTRKQGKAALPSACL